MSLFSRIFVILTCFTVSIIAVAAAVLAWTIPLETIDWLRNAVDWLADHNADTEKTILAAAAAAIALFAVVIVILEMLPRSGTDVKVTDLKIGDAVLSTAAIGQRVEEAVHRVPHIAAVKAAVKAKRKGVLVSLDLYVDPDANLATVTDEACGAATDVLTNRVHVALQEPPHARLHYRELRLHGRPAAVQVGAKAPVTVAPGTPPTSSAPERPRPGAETPFGQTLIRQPTDPSVAAPISTTHEGAVAVAEPEAALSDRPKEAPAE